MAAKKKNKSKAKPEPKRPATKPKQTAKPAPKSARSKAKAAPAPKRVQSRAGVEKPKAKAPPKARPQAEPKLKAKPESGPSPVAAAPSQPPMNIVRPGLQKRADLMPIGVVRVTDGFQLIEESTFYSAPGRDEYVQRWAARGYTCRFTPTNN
jgi:hypothetical protein